MGESRHDGTAPGGTPGERAGGMDRRTFLSTSALLGLGFATGCEGVGRDWNGLVAGPSLLQSVPNGNPQALAIFNASGTAQQLAGWLAGHNLSQEPARALLYQMPAVSNLPPGVTAEERPSLIGESAYKTFQNDAFATSNFTTNQMASLATVARADMASEIGSLIQYGGPVLAMSCCCCCCCCSVCCCSCNGGDNGGSDTAAFQVAAVPYGDSSVNYGGPVRSYFRGMIGVQHNGEAIAVLEAVGNDPAMTVHEVKIAVIDRTSHKVRTFGFTPAQLDQYGAQALAGHLFGSPA